MSSYFTVTLDTTPPIIQIVAPQYTSVDLETEIRVLSNEPLLEWQNVYVEDSLGALHEYTFERVSDIELYGVVRFNECPIGIATIYCSLKDDVGNISSLYSKSINIYAAKILQTNIEVVDRAVNLKTATRTPMCALTGGRVTSIRTTRRTATEVPFSREILLEGKVV